EALFRPSLAIRVRLLEPLAGEEILIIEAAPQDLFPVGVRLYLVRAPFLFAVHALAEHLEVGVRFLVDGDVPLEDVVALERKVLELERSGYPARHLGSDHRAVLLEYGGYGDVADRRLKDRDVVQIELVDHSLRTGRSIDDLHAVLVLRDEAERQH